MRNISKAERCIEAAKRCSSQAESLSFCMMLAPTPEDYELCARKYSRAVSHAMTYVRLANYYGGK